MLMNLISLEVFTSNDSESVASDNPASKNGDSELSENTSWIPDNTSEVGSFFTMILERYV